MKQFAFGVLLYLVAMILSAEASLIVHKGTAATNFATATGTAAQSQKVYFIYDNTSAQGRMIFVSTKNKTVIDMGARFYGFARPKTGTKFYNYFVTSSSSFTTNASFNAGQTYLKGLETNLFLLTSTSGAFSYPKIFAGSFTYIDGSGVATLATLTLTFDAKDTQAKNTAGQSSLQASQNIRGLFTALGYTDITQ